MAIPRVVSKLAGMQKPDSFVVYPGDPDRPNLVIVQGERAIGVFDKTTGRGLLNWRGSGPKYFVHLARAAGARPYEFPREFVLMCLESRPSVGDEVGAGVTVG